MVMEKQRTLKKAVKISGIALHTGVRAHLTLAPAPENSGVNFIRVDIEGHPSIKAVVKNVVDVKRGTTIASGNATVYTVEHVLSALHAAGIDNACVEMDGPEPPILDGSALPYYKMVKNAGIAEQSSPAAVWSASQTLSLEENGTVLVVMPCDKLKITCIIDFKATPLDFQMYSSEINPVSFENDIAPARTFCQYKELEQLLSMGLVKGGSLDNAIVLHDQAIICKDGMRFDNELVRHKILDIVGDFFLCGCRVKAHVIAIKPGHPTNIMMVQKMFSQSKL